MPGAPGRSGGNRVPGADRTKFDGLPSKPDDLPEPVGLVWTEVVDQLSELSPQALRKIDGHQIRNLVSLIYMSRTQSAKLFEDPSDLKLLRIYHATVAHIHRLSASFGLTPADRRRMDLEEKQELSDADAWLAERMTRKVSN